MATTIEMIDARNPAKPNPNCISSLSDIDRGIIGGIRRFDGESDFLTRLALRNNRLGAFSPPDDARNWKTAVLGQK